MTDQEYETTVSRIKASVEKWVKPLGLLWWREVTMEYYRDSAGLSKAIGREAESELIADTHVDWQYCQAVVRWNVAKVVNETDEDLDYFVRHELAHILVREMREWGDTNSDNKIAHEERVCTMLAQAFDSIWKAALESVAKPEEPKS